MRKFLASIFNETTDQPEKKAVSQTNLQIATAALLLEIAGVDDEFTGKEKETIVSVLKKHFGLSDSSVKEILEMTEEEIDHRIDMYYFTKQLNDHFDKALKMELGDGYEYQTAVSRVAKSGSVRGLNDVSDAMKIVYVTAHDVAWEWHVRTQAAFQKYTDNAVSKTVNFPASATISEIKGAYMLSWKLGCKGVTVYRDSSKSFQVLSHSEEQKKGDGAPLIQSRIAVKTLKQRKAEGLMGTKKDFETCPECGGVVSVQEGCNLCHECGWSVCSS